MKSGAPPSNPSQEAESPLPSPPDARGSVPTFATAATSSASTTSSTTTVTGTTMPTASSSSSSGSGSESCSSCGGSPALPEQGNVPHLTALVASDEEPEISDVEETDGGGREERGASKRQRARGLLAPTPGQRPWQRHAHAENPDADSDDSGTSPRLWRFLGWHLRGWPPGHLIQLLDRQQGLFLLSQPEELARLWGQVKRNSAMTYEKFSRGLRYYYKTGVLTKVRGKLKYRFNTQSQEWRQIWEMKYPSTSTSSVAPAELGLGHSGSMDTAPEPSSHRASEMPGHVRSSPGLDPFPQVGSSRSEEPVEPVEKKYSPPLSTLPSGSLLPAGQAPPPSSSSGSLPTTLGGPSWFLGPGLGSIKQEEEEERSVPRTAGSPVQAAASPSSFRHHPRPPPPPPPPSPSASQLFQGTPESPTPATSCPAERKCLTPTSRSRQETGASPVAGSALAQPRMSFPDVESGGAGKASLPTGTWAPAGRKRRLTPSPQARAARPAPPAPAPPTCRATPTMSMAPPPSCMGPPSSAATPTWKATPTCMTQAPSKTPPTCMGPPSSCMGPPHFTTGAWSQEAMRRRQDVSRPRPYHPSPIPPHVWDTDHTRRGAQGHATAAPSQRTSASLGRYWQQQQQQASYSSSPPPYSSTHDPVPFRPPPPPPLQRVSEFRPQGAQFFERSPSFDMPTCMTSPFSPSSMATPTSVPHPSYTAPPLSMAPPRRHDSPVSMRPDLSDEEVLDMFSPSGGR